MAPVTAAAVRGEILARPAVRSRVAGLAESAGRPVADVVAELDADLREMVATHGGPAGDVFLHIGRVFDRAAYRGRVRVDPAQVARLQDLNRRYPMALLPSHRSYIDPVVLASVLQRVGLPPTYKLGGINVAFWPMGPMGRRAGLIFIRRSFRDDAVYKLALREYVGWLAEHRQNLEWYIEGGRTRTGKLRDPRLGLLAYLVDAVQDDRCDDFLLQPVSIVYDELLDVEEHARSATGAAKTPESLGRLITYARAQRTRYSRGDIHVAFGEPISVRDHLTRELEAAVDAGETEALPLQKLAFEVAVRINAVTPITPPALITMALLWADRALTVDQLLVLLERYAVDVDERRLPVTARPVAARETVLSGLSSLQRHGVVTRFDGGREPVYLIQPEQRIAASYYRNGILHFYLIPAITDLADTTDDALRLRDLLKFEFFFAEKAEFLAEVDAERARPERPVTAPFLRPFLEAYWVVAEALRARGDEPVTNTDPLLADAFGLGEQYLLQHRIYCADAVSSSYADGAIRLAEHRDLLAPDDPAPDLAAQRGEFADELHALVRRGPCHADFRRARILEGDAPVTPDVVSEAGLVRPAARPPLPVGAQTIPEAVAAARAAIPDADAVIGRHTRLTYADLDDHVLRAAAGLAAAGVGPGDRVAGSMANHPELVVAFLATMHLGAIWVGINRALTGPEQRYLLDDAGVSAYVGDRATAEAASELRPDLPGLRLVVDAEPGDPTSEWAAMLRDASPRSAPTAAVDPFAPAAIAYTSGTTGQPKGVVHSQHNLLLVGAVGLATRRAEDDRTGVLLPLSILNLMILGPVSTVQAGTCTVCIDRADAVGLASWIRDEGVTSFSAVPTIIHDLLTHPDVTEADLASIVRPGCGGGVTPDSFRRLYEERFGTRLTTGYGLTEAPTAVTTEDPALPRVPDGSGRAPAHVTVTIQTDDGTALAAGEVGEVCVGPATDGMFAGVYTPMLGYWNRPDATAAALRDGVLRTGDLGYLTDAGDLVVTDRKGDLILRGGANVYPAEVERVLYQDPRVGACAVVGLPDERLGERVVAAIVRAGDEPLSAEELREHCARSLARYKIPERFLFVDDLPRNAMGKVVKRLVVPRFD